MKLALIYASIHENLDKFISLKIKVFIDTAFIFFNPTTVIFLILVTMMKGPTLMQHLEYQSKHVYNFCSHIKILFSLLYNLLGI